ncbi:MAG: response regulator [Chloroflexi bacterium]|nr:response regulator [Chloroflexota bacterium]
MSGHQPECVASPRLHILVVEDDKDTRRFLAELFEDEGFTVQTAANGVVGLRLLRAFAPDLLLVDLQMPDLDGLGLYDAMQADPALAGVPVIFMSAAPDWRGLARRGIQFCLVKPFDIDHLLQTINAVVQGEGSQPSPSAGLYPV